MKHYKKPFPELPEGAYETKVVVEYHEYGPSGVMNFRGIAPTSVNLHPDLIEGLEVLMNEVGLHLGHVAGAELFPHTISVLETIFTRQVGRALAA